MRRAHLEESCRDRVSFGGSAAGVERLQAWFAGTGYSRHRHDTYAIGLTDSGVQSFWYRGAVRRSTPGEIVVLHPDEIHDGYAGTAEGFGYRIVYVHPVRVLEACRSILGRTCALPFVARPVLRNARLRGVIEDAFASEMTSLGADALVLALTEELLRESEDVAAARPCIDKRAVERARQFLSSTTDRAVHSSELEAVTGLTRFDLARQFRAQIGTSPYRYSLMRRLERVRNRIGDRPIVELALEAGFSDQPHFTRAFKAAYGVTPARDAALNARLSRHQVCDRADG
jgi:AraC-like DNA-binding protein